MSEEIAEEFSSLGSVVIIEQRSDDLRVFDAKSTSGKAVERARTLRAWRHVNQVCRRCGGPLAPNNVTYCVPHRDEARQEAASASRAYRERKKGMREKLKKTREGLTLHFTITSRAPEHMQVPGQPPKLIEVDGYVTTGVYEDGRLGEFFIRVGQGAGGLGPAIDRWAEACSIAFQYGVPIEVVLRKSIATHDEVSGPVSGVVGINKCTSPHDLIAKWLLSKYGPKPEPQPEETAGVPVGGGS